MRTLKFILTILLAATFTISNAQGTWVPKTNFGGTERHGAVGFSIGNKGYIGTGHHEGSYYKDFWEYDPASDAWSQKADFDGTPRYWGTAFSVDTKGYVGLGYGGTNDFWEYDATGNTWSQIADFPGGGRFGAVGFAIGNKGYVGTGSWQNDFWEYDPAADTWTQRANFGGTARATAAGFSIGNRGYIGTGAKDYFTPNNDFWEYNPSSDTWTRKADFGGEPRKEATGFSIGAKGYIGTGVDPTGYLEYNNFWEYDPSSNKWIEIDHSGIFARTLAVGFSIGSKGYFGTGSGEIEDLNDFREYTPAEEPACVVPANLSSTKVTATSVRLNWDAIEGSTGYIIRYKVVGSSLTIVKSTTSDFKKLSGLTPETSYMWQVKTVCSTVPPVVSSEWSAKQYFTTGSLKIGDDQSTPFNIYPNPTSGQFTIAMTLDEQVTSSAIVQVTNSLGQIVYNEKTSIANGMLLQEIQLNNLPAGMYLVKVIVNDQVYSALLNYSE